MKENQKQRSRKLLPRIRYRADKIMSVKLLSSYLLLICAPLFAIIFTYYQAKNALLEVQYEKAGSLMTEAFTSIDRQMEEVHNISAYMLGDSDILHFIRDYDSKNDEFWDKYCYVQSQPNYSLTNEIVESVYVLVKDSRYMIRLPMVAPVSDLGFVSINQFAVDSYDTLLNMLCSEWYYGKVLSIEDEKGEGKLAMVHTIGSVKAKKSGVILITLNHSVLSKILESACPDEASVCMMISNEEDQVGMIVTGSGERCSLSDTQLKRLDLEGFVDKISKDSFTREEKVKTITINGKETPYQIIKLNGTKYLVYARKSNVQNWTCVTITPLKTLLDEIRPVKNIMIFMAVLTALISIGLCLRLWNRRRKVIAQYYALRVDLDAAGRIDPAGTNVEKAASGVLKTDFWSGIRDIFDYLSDLRTAMSLQKNLAEDTVLKKLLYGEYSSHEELLQDLKKTGMEFPAKDCYCMVIYFDEPQNTGSFRNITEFRAFIRDYLREKVKGHHYLYELSSDRFVILLSDEMIRQETDLVNGFLSLQAELKELVLMRTYAGCAEPVTDLMKLYRAFELAREACEYAAYYELTIPVKGEELPPLNTDMFLPPALEDALSRALTLGSEKELSAVLDKIRENNEKKKPGLAITAHYMNFVRSAALKSLAPFCSEDSMLEKVGEITAAADWDDLNRLILEAKNRICTEARSRSSAEPDDQKRIILDFIGEHYTDPNFSLAMLAEYLGVSESKIYKDFRVYFGKSFAEMLETMRIGEACRLLKAGSTVKDAAAASGYSSDPSFRRAFKRVMGVTPSEYL